MPATDPLAIVVAVVEFCGFVCVLVGLMTRNAALLMALFNVIAAAVIGHRFCETTDPVMQFK